MTVLDTLTKIIFLLKKDRLNQKALTDYLGLQKNTFTNWKNGGSSSYMKYLPQIAEFFNVSIDYLAGRETPDGSTLYYSGNNDIDSIVKDLLSKDITDGDLEVIKAILNKYK